MPTLKTLALACIPLLTACTSHSSRVSPAPIDLFTSGESGHAVYRIPAATRLASGRLLVFAEARESSDDNVSNDIVLKRSDDGGASWSPLQLVLDEPGRSLNNPCVVQCTRGAHAGRVVMPFNQGPPNDWRVYAACSDDGGDTWRMGDTAPEDGAGHANEVQMAERADGSLLLVARQFGGGARRKSAVSSDGGATWTRLAAVPDLPDPSCMGGLANVGAAPGALLACTGPASERTRVDGRAWFSTDGGETWPCSVPVQQGSFAYSVPVPLDGGRMGVVFECDAYRRIAFVVLDDVRALSPEGRRSPGS